MTKYFIMIIHTVDIFSDKHIMIFANNSHRCMYKSLEMNNM